MCSVWIAGDMRCGEIGCSDLLRVWACIGVTLNVGDLVGGVSLDCSQFVCVVSLDAGDFVRWWDGSLSSSYCSEMSVVQFVL